MPNDVVSTITTEDVAAGDTALPVADTDGFAEGDEITITSAGEEIKYNIAETNTVAGFAAQGRRRRAAAGGLLLREPLQFGHPAGATVEKKVATLDDNQDPDTKSGKATIDQKDPESDTSSMLLLIGVVIVVILACIAFRGLRAIQKQKLASNQDEENARFGNEMAKVPAHTTPTNDAVDEGGMYTSDWTANRAGSDKTIPAGSGSGATHPPRHSEPVSMLNTSQWDAIAHEDEDATSDTSSRSSSVSDPDKPIPGAGEQETESERAARIRRLTQQKLRQAGLIPDLQWDEYQSNLEKVGFFDGYTPGTLEYEGRMSKAKLGFQKSQG